MSGESALRDQVRQAILSGKLPNRRPERMWGGPGSGAVCSICGKPLNAQEMELDLEYEGHGEDRGCIKHEVHVQCFAAWESERQNFAVAVAGTESVGAQEPGAKTPSSTDDVAGSTSVARLNGRALPAVADDGTIAARERSKKGLV